jgi:hypothetical protein
LVRRAKPQAANMARNSGKLIMRTIILICAEKAQSMLYRFRESQAQELGMTILRIKLANQKVLVDLAQDHALLHL